MNLIPHLKIMRAALRKSGVRALMAGVSVAATVAAIMIATGLSNGARREAERLADQGGRNLFVINATKSRPLPGHGQGWVESRRLNAADVRELDRAGNGIRVVAPVLDAVRRVKLDRHSTVTTIRGVTPEFLVLRHFDVDHGRTLDAADLDQSSRVAMLGASVAQRLGNGEDLVGQGILIDGAPYDVIAVLAPKGLGITGSDDDAQILIPVTTAQRRLMRSDHYSSLLVQAVDAAGMAHSQAVAADLIRDNHRLGAGQHDDFEVLDLIRANEMRERNSAFLRGISGLFAAITLVVSVIGVLAVAYLNVKDRTGEIGLRMAIGAKRRSIAWLFIGEAMVLSVLGGLAGLLLGAVAVAILHWLTEWQMEIGPLDAVLPFLASACVGALAGLLPALKAARMMPVTALRSA